MSHCPLIEAMRAEATPGRCIACDEPLPPYKGVGRRRCLCGSLACKRLYSAMFSLGMRAEKKRRKEARRK